MSLNISKVKLKKISLFSICSKKYGYGHYSRAIKLERLLKNKNTSLSHYSFGEKIKNKEKFINLIKTELNLENKIVLDLTNNKFLSKNLIIRLKKIIVNSKSRKVYIIDSPEKINLTSKLNLSYVKCLIPYEVDKKLYKDLSIIKKKLIGIKYYVFSKYKTFYPRNKLFTILISFGGSDNFNGTHYVLKLIEKLNFKNKLIVKVIFGKYFKNSYQKKLNLLCKKNNFKVLNFSSKFNYYLKKSNLLITNSGLTKYEGFFNGIPVFVFSDTAKSQKIDKLFTNKVKQMNFSYLKKQKKDLIKLNYAINKQIKKVSSKNITINLKTTELKKFFLIDE